MRRVLGLLTIMILATSILGCGGSTTAPNKGPTAGEVPKEQKESDDLMHGKGATPK